MSLLAASRSGIFISNTGPSSSMLPSYNIHPERASPTTRFCGRKGDPRMHRAVSAKLRNPQLSLLDALLEGGFTFPVRADDIDDVGGNHRGGGGGGGIHGSTLDSDGVSLVQRKNQLGRRLRMEHVRKGRKRQNRTSEGGGSAREENNVPPAASEEPSSSSGAPARATAAGPKRRRVAVAGTLPSTEEDPRASGNRPSSPDPPTTAPPGGDAATEIDLTIVARSGILAADSCQSSARGPVPPVDAGAVLSSLLVPPFPSSEAPSCVPAAPSSTAPIEAPSKLDVDSSPSETAIDENTGKFLLSTFNLDPNSCPTFSEYDERREEAELSKEEREAILADIRGERRPLKARRRRSLMRLLMGVGLDADGDKDGFVTQDKLRRLVPRSIKMLLAEVRQYVEKVQDGSGDVPPLDEMVARMARSETDQRLELFLRRENMDPKQAANRLVSYWSKRREVFGPDKFHLPMTLDGAMRDDRVALETGTYQILPKPDESGRRILMHLNYRQTGIGYTNESMIRTHWYFLESMLEDIPGTRRGIVILSWDEHTSLWNYDRSLDAAMLNLERFYVPIRFCSIHVCTPPSLVLTIAKPFLFASMDRRLRSRTTFHMEKGKPLFEELRDCGITTDVLPFEMGGQCTFNHAVWLQERRYAGK